MKQLLVLALSLPLFAAAGKTSNCVHDLEIPKAYARQLKIYSDHTHLTPLLVKNLTYDGTELKLRLEANVLRPHEESGVDTPYAELRLVVTRRDQQLEADIEHVSFTESLPSEYVHRLLLAHALNTVSQVTQVSYIFQDTADGGSVRERVMRGRSVRSAIKHSAPYRAIAAFGFKFAEATMGAYGEGTRVFPGDGGIQMTLKRR